MVKTVTNIKYSRRDPNLAAIYVDGTYAFSVSLLEAASLHTGSKLTPAQFARFLKEHQLYTAYKTAIGYLTRSPRSFHEIQCHLRKKKYSAETIDACMEKLNQNGYIDDTNYARLFVEQRIRFNPRSKYALRFELSRKGIDAEVVEEVVSPLNDYDLAFAAVTKKMRRWHTLPEADLKIKVMSFLSQRGFGYDVAGDTFDRVLRDRQ